MHVFGVWEDVGVPIEGQHTHSTQKDPSWLVDSNLGSSSYEISVPTSLVEVRGKFCRLLSGHCSFNTVKQLASYCSSSHISLT